MGSPSVALLILLLVCKLCTGTRIIGVVTHPSEQERSELSSDRVPFYLAKFGVAAGQEMYVFGTVKADTTFIRIRSRMLLVLVPQNISDRLVYSTSCKEVFNSALKESMFVSGAGCSGGTKDYVREFPCSHSTSCNQPEFIPIVTGNDFTFHIENAPKTEFYYLFMLACDRNSTLDCEWDETDESSLQYDISLVNSNPQNNSHLNPFVYQFSLEFEGVLVIQLLFTIAYFLMLIVHLLMHCGACKKLCNTSQTGCQMHRLPALFTASLALEFIHVLFELIHFSVFASDGIGAVWCKYLGEVTNQFSDWLLILVLLLIGKGWMVTDSALRRKKLTFGIWSVYVFFFLVYFVWTVIQDQVFPLSISTSHTFQSWPGGFYLAYRLALLGYILYEMRQIYLVENRPEKLKLYFALSFLYVIWFCYLPFIVFVIAFIDPLFKLRVVTVFLLSFDFLANLGVVVLFVPRWAKLIFQFDSHLNTVSMNSGYKGLKNFYYGSSESSTTNVI